MTIRGCDGCVPVRHWLRAAGFDNHYDGKWHISHADLTDPLTGESLATNDDDGVAGRVAVRRYLDADPPAHTAASFEGLVVPPRRHGGGRAGASLETRAVLRRPGHVDRARGSPSCRRRRGRAVLSSATAGPIPGCSYGPICVRS